MKKTFLQIAGIVGIVGMILGTVNSDAQASHRYYRHHHHHHYVSHHHGHRR